MQEEVVISVEDLSKRFRIGLAESKHETLGSQIMAWITYPLRNFRNLFKLSRFNSEEDSRDVHWALKELNFSANRGDVLGIIGHNGAGKSTLLKILSRISEPTKGSISIKGKVSSLLEVGTGFHPDLTGRDNVYMNGTILGMSKKEIDKKFDQILSFSGIGKYIDTPVKRYSSGMKVRLAFSVAAHLDPEVLIIDEVLAVGDAEFQKRCLGKMEEVSKQGRTVLFVSHNMVAVENLCNKAIVLNEGRIVKKGTTQECTDFYLNEMLHGQAGEDSKTLDKEYSFIKDLEIIAPKGIKSGEGIAFSTNWDRSKTFQSITISFKVLDEKNDTLFVANNKFSDLNPIEISEKAGVQCKIEKLPLMPGSYILDLFLKIDGEIVVSNQLKKRFEVHPGDFFNSGKLPNPDGGGKLLVKQEWSTDPFY